MKKIFVSSVWILAPALIAAVFYIAVLGRLPLEDADEATYAMIVREMVRSGHYLTLTLFGAPWVDKPPLLFWLMAFSVKLFGFTEFAFRLPAALFGILAVALTAGIIWEFIRKKEPAFIGALLLLFMPLFLATTRNVRMEVPVIVSILAAFYFFLKGRMRPFSLIGFGSAIGIGILFKSVIALIAVPLIFLYSIVYRDWFWVKNKYFWIGGALGVCIASPWHLYEAILLGLGFFPHYFGFQLGRVTQNIIESHITNGYALWIFWKYGQPLSSVLLFSVLWYVVFILRNVGNSEKWRHIRFGVFSFAAFAFTFGIFMPPATRLIPYFVVSYPFLAMFAAAAYESIVASGGLMQKNILRGAAIIVIIIGLQFGAEEVFSDRHLYATNPVFDSKAIGTIILGRQKKIPVYLYEYSSDQTIQYYSDRRVVHLTENKSATLSPPFLLVLPTPLLQGNLWLYQYPQPYKGDYLTLVDVEK